jgi:hypothetical protein
MGREADEGVAGKDLELIGLKNATKKYTNKIPKFSTFLNAYHPKCYTHFLGSSALHAVSMYGNLDIISAVCINVNFTKTNFNNITKYQGTYAIIGGI